MENKPISAEELIEQIAKDRRANFEASWDLIDWTRWHKLLADINPTEGTIDLPDES